MNKFIAIYLAIRTPLLWVSLFIALVCTGIINWIALFVWLFTLVFSEYSYDRYIMYKKKKNDEYIDD